VWRIVRCLVGHEADARDCYQSVFLDASQYAKKQPVEDWERLLHRLARCRALDLLRKRYRSAARIDGAADPHDSFSRIPSPEAEVEAVELAEHLRVCLGLLPVQQAEVFVMRFVEQLSYDEIASRIGSNRNAVGAALNRARNQLRQSLEEERSATANSQRKPHAQ
jgi:RNA polymerase sigma-70 factor (ECF subfamily)